MVYVSELRLFTHNSLLLIDMYLKSNSGQLCEDWVGVSWELFFSLFPRT